MICFVLIGYVYVKEMFFLGDVINVFRNELRKIRWNVIMWLCNEMNRVWEEELENLMGLVGIENWNKWEGFLNLFVEL